MSKNHHGGPGPVPPGNRPSAGPTPATPDDANAPLPEDKDAGAPFEEQDPKRRLGNYQSAGEHAIQQPGHKNDGGTHSQ